MPRYIDVESKDFPMKTFTGSSIFAAGWNDCINTIMCMPTADVQEVKHGKWIIRDGSRAFQYYDGTVSYEDCGCSRCGKWGYSDMKYCPHCGARMDDKEKKDEEVH